MSKKVNYTCAACGITSRDKPVYFRHLAEKHFFDEVAINRHLPEMQPYIDQLTECQKRELEDYVNYIIAKKESVAS